MIFSRFHNDVRGKLSPLIWSLIFSLVASPQSRAQENSPHIKIIKRNIYDMNYQYGIKLFLSPSNEGLSLEQMRGANLQEIERNSNFRVALGNAIRESSQEILLQLSADTLVNAASGNGGTASFLRYLNLGQLLVDKIHASLKEQVPNMDLEGSDFQILISPIATTKSKMKDSRNIDFPVTSSLFPEDRLQTITSLDSLSDARQSDGVRYSINRSAVAGMSELAKTYLGNDIDRPYFASLSFNVALKKDRKKSTVQTQLVFGLPGNAAELDMESDSDQVKIEHLRMPKVPLAKHIPGQDIDASRAPFAMLNINTSEGPSASEPIIVKLEMEFGPIKEFNFDQGRWQRAEITSKEKYLRPALIGTPKIDSLKQGFANVLQPQGTVASLISLFVKNASPPKVVFFIDKVGFDLSPSINKNSAATVEELNVQIGVSSKHLPKSVFLNLTSENVNTEFANAAQAAVDDAVESKVNELGEATITLSDKAMELMSTFINGNNPTSQGSAE